jgi:hypothetical protein
LKILLARFDDETYGGALFSAYIDGGELGEADDINPIFLKVPTGDGDRFNSLVYGPSADRLHIGSMVLADNSGDCTSDSRSA